MKPRLVLLCTALLTGCTATFTITPYQRPVEPFHVAETLTCEETVLPRPSPIPDVPKLSKAARADSEKAYLELVKSYKELRQYTKDLIQTTNDYLDQPSCK